jgi:sugar phosphate isomerase/epimerase
VTLAAAITPGLCSVTFRALPAERVIALATEAGLAAIEWGMDVHLPPGETAQAAALAAACHDAGIATPTIGSYLRCTDEDGDQPAAVFDTAIALGAAVVRVWAGRSGSGETAAAARAAPVARLRSSA